jgi:hypothetical protein
MTNAHLNRMPIAVLQGMVALIGIVILAFLLMEPHFEGVNASATSWTQIYLDDPLLAYAYIASIPFFVALFQLFALLGSLRRGTLFAERSLQAFRTIRYCAMVMIPFVVIGAVWIFSLESDDRPPIFAMCTLASLFLIGVAVVTAKLERKVRQRM